MIFLFLGRGRRSHAYTHSVQVGHHVFLNLRTLKVDVFFGESSLKITLKEVIWSRWVESREGLPGGGRRLNSLFRIIFSVQAWLWKYLMHRLLKCRSPLPRTVYPEKGFLVVADMLTACSESFSQFTLDSENVLHTGCWNSITTTENSLSQDFTNPNDGRSSGFWFV